MGVLFVGPRYCRVGRVVGCMKRTGGKDNKNSEGFLRCKHRKKTAERKRKQRNRKEKENNTEKKKKVKYK